MLSALLLLSSTSPAILRDPYGVPMIRTATRREAFVQAGFAAAEDRLWQMENSRRLARGRMAEVFGPNYASSDREILRFGATEADLKAQLARLSPEVREAFEAYAEGVSAGIQARKSRNELPPGYTEHGFEPEPWTPIDSAAISVGFFQRFGRGGAGELRNWALLQYFQGRPNLKGRVLDVMDDLAWFNDPTATTTVAAEDDPQRRNPPRFAMPTRPDSERHLAQLPKVGILELMGAIRVAERADSTLVAQRIAAPTQLGSYAIVVAPTRSAAGHPILLSAPQMGWQNPSIVTEVSMKAPGLAVTGMTVPGVPGVLIGTTPDVAWGMTTGVADTEDVVYVQRVDDESYQVGSRVAKYEVIRQTLKIKGRPDETVVQKRTPDGPVILESRSGGVAFVRRSSFWQRELQGFESLYGIYAAKSSADLRATVGKATLNFNAFFATRSGEIGFQYAGKMPVRTPGWDPRLPIPASAAWLGEIPVERMPQVVDPKSGLLVNWNNKPVAWWPNLDTPVWGRIFRDRILREALPPGKLTVEDVELAAWRIARTDDTHGAFRKYLRAIPDTPDGRALKGWNGQKLAGSRGAHLYGQWLRALREELFQPALGNLTSPENFHLALQPSMMLRALERKTKFDYLAGRPVESLVRAAFEKAVARAGNSGYSPGTIPIKDDAPIAYSERGTYIQIIELGATPRGRNVLAPGNAENGPHQHDQAILAREWRYKPMVWPER